MIKGKNTSKKDTTHSVVFICTCISSSRTIIYLHQRCGKEDMKKYFAEKNFSLNSTKTYIYWIKKYMQWSGGIISISKILEYRDKIMDDYSVGTQKIIISALKCLVEYRQMNLKLCIPKQHAGYDITVIDREEYIFLVNNLIWENSFCSLRNKEMLKVMWFTGMRISEIINLKWSDIKANAIKIESKNNKKRFIPFKSDMFDELKRIKLSQYVFSKADGGKLSYSAITTIFKKVKNIRKDITPHTFRHSFATRIIEKGVPLNYVSEMLGHSSVSTTMIYIHTNIDVIEKMLKEKDWN